MAYRVNQQPSDIFQKKRVWWIVGLSVGAIAIITLSSVIVTFEIAYAHRFYPGVTIGSLNVSGKTIDAVRTMLSDIEDKLQNEGLIFSYQDETVAVTPIVVSNSPDLAKEIITLNLEQTAHQAFAIGRSGNVLTNLLTQLKVALFGKTTKTIYSLDHQVLLDHLQTNFSKYETPPVNAQITIVDNEVVVTPETPGHIFNYAHVTNDVEQQLASLVFHPITLELKSVDAEITQTATAGAVASVENILEISGLTLTHDDKTWIIDKDTLISWLEFQVQDNEVVVGVNQENTVAFLEDIATEINVTATDAKFELDGNRVTEFQPSRDGVKVDVEQSYEQINTHVMLGRQEAVALVVAVDPAKVANQDLNDLGIIDLLGRGQSNFSGSPANRRHNIKVGAESLDGVLIEPGEEFSLLDALGEIDGSTGYLQELVIKGNRTIPEYGGGLCQIGSTTFRAALWSGLPITARRNHSYRVRYYEPAGMDATIYDPAPDMKFLNDTGHHILFIARMEGDDLVFEFYGTPDGRKVTIEPNPPRIYNITAPGEPRYIETEDLAPGEKKKVESAHAGADTYFKYTIEYPDGTIKEQEFNSHYVSWPEVWLVGKEASTTTDNVLPVEVPIVQN